MSPLTQALQEIDHWIETSKSWHADWIRKFGVRPGLEREMIELYSEEFDFQFSEEVCELYQWHDGFIRLGDYANPVFFESLDTAGANIVRNHIPNRPYMPLFIGDEANWVTPEAFSDQQPSPIFLYDGFISQGQPNLSYGCFRKMYMPLSRKA
jgi:hypothetical protein